MYKKIISLDFELYNTKHYWSVCWAGVCLADGELSLISKFDVIINPGIDEKFAGPDMKFPFKLKDLKRRETFDGYADAILGLLSPDTLVLGHAFENDLRMIVDVCKKFGLNVPSFDFIDTNVLYNAVSSETNEHSLASLGEKFGVEFSAHDPQEDARATLAVAKGCLNGKPLDEFLLENKIHVGKFRDGVYAKCYAESMSDARKRKIEKFNAVFDTVQKLGQGKGESCFIDNAIASEQNASRIAEELLRRGFRIAASSYSADKVITNNLSLKADEKYISLKSALGMLGLPFDGYDFTPNKIRDKENRPISITEYYKEAYAKYEKSGFLDGKSVSFSKAVERRKEFDEFIKGIISNGGSICPRVDDSDFFVVEKKSDISKNFSDGRIKAYRFSRKPKVAEFAGILRESFRGCLIMKKKAVIFDLDGTLLDTLTDLALSVNYALGSMGYAERTKDEVCSFVGNGVGSLIRKAVPDGTSAEAVAETLGIFSAHYGEHLNDNTKPYDGVEDLLDFLKEANVLTGVVSNKYHAAVKNLCTRIFGDKLGAVTGERDGVRRKPAPDGVEAVLKELNVDVSNAVYIGDSETDVMTAQNAGMDFVGVDWGFRPREALIKSGASIVASSADELKRILAAM